MQFLTNFIQVLDIIYKYYLIIDRNMFESTFLKINRLPNAQHGRTCVILKILYAIKFLVNSRGIQYCSHQNSPLLFTGGDCTQGAWGRTPSEKIGRVRIKTRVNYTTLVKCKKIPPAPPMISLIVYPDRIIFYFI